MTSDQSPTPPRFELARKLALLALLCVAVGLPINQPLFYALLLLATVVIFRGAVSTRPLRWLAALVLLAASLTGQFLVRPPVIEEGHNVFLPGGEGNALVSGLPPEVYRLMSAEFDAVYPPAQRCDPKASGCWRGQGFPDRTFAFSSDGLLTAPLFSRRVTGINFTDPVWQRFGFVNDVRYNWFSDASDLQRAKRDGRFWMGLARWQLTMPFFVAYRLPAELAGGNLCWRGDVIWEESKDRFTQHRSSGWSCRTIERDDASFLVFGVGIRPGTLMMSLDPPITVKLQQTAGPIIAILTVALLMAALVTWRARAVLLPLVMIGLSLLVIVIDDASFLGGVRPFDGGDDGLVYDSFARTIARALFDGDISAALRGGESVYFYGGPGLRYLLALNHIVFGETYFGYLSLILVLPFVVLGLFKRFLPRSWALALALSFVAIPLGILFGTSFVQYESLAARGFADPAAATFLVCAVLAMVRPPSRPADTRFWLAVATSFLFALAVWVRPNLAPFAGIAVAGAALLALQARAWIRLAGLCLGFLPVGGMALHNWYFGNAFVLFSSNAGLSNLLVTPPSVYAAALLEIVHWDFAGGSLQRAALQVAQWLRGPSGFYALVPLNIAAVLLVVYVLLRRRLDPWLRVIAAATLAQHGVALFYAATPRYHFVTWLMTFLVIVAWLHAEGVSLLRRRFPQLWGRAEDHQAVRSLYLTLNRLQETAEHKPD